MARNDNRSKLDDKADYLLQEIRIVLPGTQALLGFQFVAFFNPVFQGLSQGLQYLHFTTLLLTMACTITLIAPVAFQQIGESGRNTPRFVSFARRMLNTAMILLLLAFTGDVFLTARTIDISAMVAAGLAAGVFITGVMLWYVYVLLRKRG